MHVGQVFAIGVKVIDSDSGDVESLRVFDGGEEELSDVAEDLVFWEVPDLFHEFCV